MRVITILGLGLVLSLGSCDGTQKTESTNPNTEDSVLAPSLNREQRARLDLLGRTSAPTRYSERTDANRIRVVAIDFGGVTLGQCADTEGNLLTVDCKPWYGSTSAVPRDADEPMTAGMFRQYSTQVGTTVEASAAIGPVGAETKVYFSRNFLVLEWRRYNLDMLELNSIGQIPIVTAVEMGIAVRIIFDVRLRTADAKLTASFGIADLSTALARNEATVEVSYEILGTTLDPVPTNAIIITSLNEYITALEEFYNGVSTISRALTIAAGGEININEGTSLPPKTITVSETTFKPQVLAYYISGRDVGANYDALINVDECQSYVAKSDYLKADIAWNKAVIADYEAREKKLDTAQKTVLNRARKDLIKRYDDLRELAALSAQLDCKRACDAEVSRLKKKHQAETWEFKSAARQALKEVALSKAALERVTQDLTELKSQAAQARSAADKKPGNADLEAQATVAVAKVKDAEVYLESFRYEVTNLDSEAKDADSDAKDALVQAQAKHEAATTLAARTCKVVEFEYDPVYAKTGKLNPKETNKKKKGGKKEKKQEAEAKKKEEEEKQEAEAKKKEEEEKQEAEAKKKEEEEKQEAEAKKKEEEDAKKKEEEEKQEDAKRGEPTPAQSPSEEPGT